MTRLISVVAGIIVFAMQGAVLFADESQDAPTQAQTDKIHQLDERVNRAEDIAAKNRVASLRRRFDARVEQDRTTYTQQELKEIESLYQIANKKWNSPEAKESLKKLTVKYTKANRTGCALLYLGQMASGKEKEQHLKRAIDEFNDCWYGDGVQVGAYARFYLANYYQQIGKKVEASAIFDEIRKDYPDAINHSGRLIVDTLPQRADKSKTDEIGKISKVKKTRKIILTKNHILILPLFILVFAAYFRLFPPKKINRFYGYRTRLSMINQDTWDFANRFSANTLLIGAVAYLLFVTLCVVTLDAPKMLLWISVSVLVMLFWVIILTEWRLRKKLDASGDMIKEHLNALRHRVGWLGISVLMIPILGWVWLVASDPVHFVFSGGVFVLIGELFSKPFDIIHAGSTLDQPTIGKWLFWFTVMAISALPYSLLIRWLSDRTKARAYIVYAIFSVVLGIFLLCILSFPFLLLIQYIYSMGVTPRRIHGMIYAVIGGILTIGFIAVAFRKPRDMSENTSQPVAVRWWFVPFAFVVILGILTVLINFQTWTAQYYCLKMVDHQQVTKECIELLRTTQFAKEIQSVTYLPQKTQYTNEVLRGTYLPQNWSSLPSGLRKLNLEFINVNKQSIVLRKSRAAVFVFKPCKTNDSTWELMFYGYSPLYQIKRKILAVEP